MSNDPLEELKRIQLMQLAQQEQIAQNVRRWKRYQVGQKAGLGWVLIVVFGLAFVAMACATIGGILTQLVRTVH